MLEINEEILNYTNTGSCIYRYLIIYSLSCTTHCYNLCRSTPCPNVKHGDEWGEPTSCENGDTCIYCHTRTEQQFHPEIYKSSKCNDVQQSGYCPRGAFCAFAHLDGNSYTYLCNFYLPELTINE